MEESLIITALVNVLLGAFLLSKTGDETAASVPLDAKAAGVIYSVLAAIYAMTALVLLAAVPLV